MQSVPQIRDFRGKRIHMIGVGGSSMSGLAEMLADQGYEVTGSDRTDGYLMDDVRAKGIRVMIGHHPENVHGASLVVYTAAIPADNPEMLEAKRLGIPTMERAYLLGQLMDTSACPVAVCGAHGKTTTTSMLSQVLVDCGADPSVHIGGKLDAIGGSTRIGHGDVFLAEACEFNRSFLKMKPKVAVVLNIDADHLDCYRDLDEIEETFGQFLSLLPPDGTAIGKGTDERIMRQMNRLTCRKLTFGLREDCDFHPGNLTEDDQGYSEYDLVHASRTLAHIKLSVPGMFNVENSLAVMAAAFVLGADIAKAAESVASFRGAHRRFELTGYLNGAELFHDYGHNPAEMRNVIGVARKRCRKTLVAVMQPHTFSRVKSLFNEYLTCTEAADITLVTDICAAREKDPGDINSGMIVDGMMAHGLKAVWTPTFDDTEAWLREHLRPGDLAITLGCGDINLLNDQINMHEEAGRASLKE